MLSQQQWFLEQLKSSHKIPFKIYQESSDATRLSSLRKTFRSCVFHTGDQHFNQLAMQYLTTHPSSSYDLSAEGKGFTQFLTCQNDAPLWLAELAQFEWSWYQVFHGAPRKIENKFIAHFQTKLAELGLNITMQTAMNHCLVDTSFPLIELWQAAQPEFKGEAVILNKEPRSYILFQHNNLVQILEIDGPALWLLRFMNMPTTLQNVCLAYTEEVHQTLDENLLFDLIEKGTIDIL